MNTTSDWLTRTPEERFWSKVENDGDCLVWTAYRDQRGYGVFGVGGRKTKKAHRVSWEWANGPIPEGIEIHHTCKNRACVNVGHLQAVTRLEHGHLDGFAYNAVKAMRAKTHCTRGHELTDENTYRHKGTRYCRKCKAQRQKEYADRLRARGLWDNATGKRVLGEVSDELLVPHDSQVA
jgi:hypothetical protein